VLPGGVGRAVRADWHLHLRAEHRGGSPGAAVEASDADWVAPVSSHKTLGFLFLMKMLFPWVVLVPGVTSTKDCSAFWWLL
jgi:hypothetical protein